MTAHPEVRPAGTWPSPISPAWLAAGVPSINAVVLSEGQLYWTEQVPTEAGRVRLMTAPLAAPTAVRELTQAPFSVRTRVHEYGGGAFWVSRGVVFAVNDRDQCLYRLAATGPATPLTPPGPWRYADGVLDWPRARLLCVGEQHRADGTIHNALISLALNPPATPEVLVGEHDFVAAPRPSPDGQRLAWLTWALPDMPWDATRLWVAHLDAAGRPLNPTLVAGGPREALAQPTWTPTGDLLYLSDRDGAWRPWRWDGQTHHPVPAPPGEVGRPQWGLDDPTLACLAPERVLLVAQDAGGDTLAMAPLTGGPLTRLGEPGDSFSQVRAEGDAWVCLAAPENQAPAIYGTRGAGVPPSRLHAAWQVPWPAASLARPRSFTAQGPAGPVQAWYYPPTHATCRLPAGERPPLLIRVHGGPTGWASPALSPKIQFWTSRGLAVADVNYSGSSGFGRAYRDRLDGRWGELDVADCVAVAQALAAAGLADPARLLISGGSAGGYLALRALAVPGVFRAGASYYGISDLAALARDTHKFESGYLDRLVGPWPAAAAVYQERSPLYQLEALRVPVLLLQGRLDPIVPPAQAECLVQALKARSIPVAYRLFEGESHGFRRAENQRRALETELAFYGAILGFTPAGDLPPIPWA